MNNITPSPHEPNEEALDVSTEPAPTSGLWGNPSASAPLGPTVVGKISNVPPHRPIRWSVLNDCLLALVLTLVSQIAIGVGIIMIWIAQNGEEIANLDAALAESELTDFIVQGPGLMVSALSMHLAWFFVLRRASKKRGIGTYAKDFWLKFRLPRDIVLGFGLAAVLRLVEWGLLNGLASLGVDMSTAENSSTILSSQGIWFFVNAILIASIIGPFMEEFLFRGLVLQSFLRLFRRFNRGRVELSSLSKTGLDDNTIALAENAATTIVDKITYSIFRARNWLAVLFSSAIFGFMHFQGFENFGQIFVILWTGTLGAIFAIVVMRTKRLGLVIFAHIFFNFSGVMLAYFTQ